MLVKGGEFNGKSVKSGAKAWGTPRRPGETRSRRVANVTADRFGGVAIPTIRVHRLPHAAPMAAGGQSPQAVGPLLQHAAGVTHDSIVSLQHVSRRIADTFRDGDYEEATGQLQGLVDSLYTLASLRGLLRGPGECDSSASGSLDPVLRLTSDLESAVTAHGHRDWNAVAGCLEGEVVAALDEWASTLRHRWELS